MASPWALLANATLVFRKPTSVTTDPDTGNEVASGYQKATVRAYFKKAELVTASYPGVPSGTIYPGVPVGSYEVDGYTVGVLPSWAKEPTNPEIQCTIDHLGKGTLYFQGKIHAVKDLVEAAGQGSQIQGYFTLQGGL